VNGPSNRYGDVAHGQGEAEAIWESLPGEFRSLIQEHACIREVERGEALRDRLGLVLSGVLAVQFIFADGRKSISELVQAGDFFDLDTTSERETGELVALTAGRVATVCDVRNRQYLMNNAHFTTYAYAQLRAQLARLYVHSAGLTCRTPLERVAGLLLEFLNRARYDSLRSVSASVFFLSLKRTDLADYVGITPETLSRCLSQLRQSRLIALPRRDCVEILDRDALLRLARGQDARAGL